MTPEFSRIERLDTIGERERAVTIEANEAERAAVAKRFGLLAVDALGGVMTVRREAAGIAVGGRVTASVVQACSVTGEPLPVEVDEPVALLFVEALGETEDEVELASDALDTVVIEGGGIDLGEAAAETMALALDPFPRSPEAAAVLKKAGVLSEDEAGPLSGLAAALKDKLKG